MYASFYWVVYDCVCYHLSCPQVTEARTSETSVKYTRLHVITTRKDNILHNIFMFIVLCALATFGPIYRFTPNLCWTLCDQSPFQLCNLKFCTTNNDNTQVFLKKLIVPQLVNKFAASVAIASDVRKGCKPVPLLAVFQADGRRLLMHGPRCYCPVNAVNSTDIPII